MRVILQHSGTRLYYQGGAKWGKSRAAAYSFCSSLAAIDFCVDNHLRKAHIILCYPKPKYDIRLDPFSPDVQKQRADARKRTKPVTGDLGAGVRLNIESAAPRTTALPRKGSRARGAQPG